MPDLVHVTDPADPRLADYVGLTDTARRQRDEPGAGLFIAEGELVIARAVAAGYRLRSLLLDERLAGRDGLVTLAGPEVPVYLAGPTVLEAVTGFHVHRGALAAVARPPPRAAGELL